MITPPADIQHILDYTPWNNLRGMRLFLTGGTGFFGRWLLDSLTAANDRLGLEATAVVLTRDPTTFARTAPHLADRVDLGFHQGDVRTFDFPDGPFTHVLHAAADAGRTGEPLDVLDTVVGGTRRALDFAAARGTKRFLLTSSGAVYGRQPPDLLHVPETFPGGPDPTDPRAVYGEGKRVAEAASCIIGRQHGFAAIIARCWAFIGPHLPLDGPFAIGNFLRDAVAGRPVRVAHNGTAVRSYMHAADLTVWLWTLLANGPPRLPVNVGSVEPVSVGELARRVAALAGVGVEVAETPPPGEPAERYVPDVARAAGLGLRMRIGLDDALARTFAAVAADRGAA